MAANLRQASMGRQPLLRPGRDVVQAARPERGRQACRGAQILEREGPALAAEPVIARHRGRVVLQRGGPELQGAMGEFLYMQGTNKNTKVADGLASKGVVNNATAASSKWVPPWEYWVENEQEIVDAVNEIYAG